MWLRLGASAVLASQIFGCAMDVDSRKNSIIHSGMTIEDIKVAVADTGGQYLEHAYHYPGEEEYLRFFTLASGRVVIAEVRFSGRELSDRDVVLSFWLPPRTFLYSKSELIELLRNHQYQVVHRIPVDTQE